MNNVVIIIFIGIIVWVVYTQMPRYYVRKFFSKAENAELLYQFFMKSNDDSEGVLVIPMSYEDVEEIYKEIENTIDYYEVTSLGDFEEETLDKTYGELREKAKELRHWLWVHNDERKKLNA